MTDERLELIIGNLLRMGVSVAAAIVAAGGVWYLAAHGSDVVDYHHFRGGERGLRALWSMTPPAVVILIGLLILIATPVARVIFALVGFAMERDRLYVIITLIVLLVLLYSLAQALLPG